MCLLLTLAQAPVRPQTPRPGQLPALPLTQLDERARPADLDNRAFTLTFAQPVSIKELLLLLVRGTSLSVVPDPAIGGAFIGELKNVTVKQALDLILPPLGLDYAVTGGTVSVFRREPETRIFDFNFIAASRTGESVVGTTGAPSVARVSTATTTDLFADVAKGVQSLLSEHATFNVDRKAGLVQVTDFPERLDRVALYLEAVHDHVSRRVQIDVRVLEVQLNDDGAPGLDWDALGRSRELTKVMEVLHAQGQVTILANPRLVALNNEPAIITSEALTLILTPQIASDGVVMLSLSPIVAAPTPAAADMLARVGDGETVVVSGFARDREMKERRNAGRSGGWFGRSIVVTKQRVELVVLLTPKILHSVTD